MEDNCCGSDQQPQGITFRQSGFHKKSRLARLQVGTSTYAVNQCLLRDLNRLGDILLRFGLGQGAGKDAVLYLG